MNGRYISDDWISVKKDKTAQGIIHPTCNSNWLVQNVVVSVVVDSHRLVVEA